MIHHFSVDVEEYFQVSAFESHVSRKRWNDFESRVVNSVSQLLEMFAEHDAGATFFVLGWVAEKHPEMVRSIAAAGHEVASHGWDHRLVGRQSRDDFRDSVKRTKELLEELTGEPVRGFRAPSFSITPGCEWALDVLIEEGHAYDSSLFPVSRPGYGYPAGRRDPHWIERDVGRIAEMPPATVRVGKLNLPAGGGAYFRLLPYSLARAAARSSAQRGHPATFYIHPWEIDPNQPRLDVSLLTRLRHYGGLGRTAKRLRRFLGEFSFRPIADTVASL
jgi:polysaccharide deacetylase family protein (PEP-CTERM system associated)